MKNIVIFLLVLLALIFGLFVIKQYQASNISSSSEEEVKTVKQYKTKINEEGNVVVEVTPINLSENEEVKFNVILETHSIDLNKDLKEISLLIDEKGNEYKAKTWTGGIGGHHLSGDLIFPPLKKDVKSVKLVIKGIEDIERIFEWEL